MADNERKCMVCGEVLGAEEQYCGKCGTKAPDGSIDKEEIEPEHILTEKKHEPWMNFSWKAQEFFCKQKKGLFSGPGSKSTFYYFLLRYDIYSMSILLYIINHYFITRNSFRILDVIQLFIHILFIILLIVISCSIYNICDKLTKFKKDAPKALYIHCGLRILACPMYYAYLMLTGMFYPVVGFIAAIEGSAGLAALIISIKYYEKRKSAFIN